ncbi:hypothetical protein [Paractinoplanes atraurantiacus]|uniref:Methyltransferase domain-containing protein n=1 Tax=Paractinoplanes atraurantiacus TaxID=1036182 RepID=A0A285IYD1_9ACTN|nr:hypothetical protein [Actinoplanes atraurantiacus]SNY52813.1 hypothetical protein SAMN05421748_113103 [Actinoplanes atraurantiacus]
MTVILLGGEMLNWSDSAPASTASLPLAKTIVGRTLVAGPHPQELISALPPDQVTVLLRGQTDAEKVAALGVRVWCGSLEKAEAAPAFDTIVALDGLDRLCSVEAETLDGWDERLAHLLSMLRPGGRLLLAVENLFGLHRLLSLPSPPTDDEWLVPDDRDPRRPASLAALRDRLAAAGLSTEREYAAYGDALLSRTSLADRDVAGFLSATLAGFTIQPSPIDSATLADPAALAVRALRHGLAADLAPSWIVIADRDSGGPATPDAVVDGQALSAAEMPRGRTLEDLLFAAAQRRDLPTMRELLTRWQKSPAAGVPAAQVVVAPAHDLSRAPAADGLTPLAPAGEPLVALRLFAAAAIQGDIAHLWPAPAEEAELTVLIAAMTGREVEPADIPALPARRTPESVRDLTADRDRLTRELAEARARHAFYEQQIRSRDAELKRVRQINAVLSATAPGKAVLGGLKAGRRAVRAVVKRGRG